MISLPNAISQAALYHIDTRVAIHLGSVNAVSAHQDEGIKQVFALEACLSQPHPDRLFGVWHSARVETRRLLGKRV